MASNAKNLVNRLKKKKEERKRKNITLSLDDAIYTEAKAHLKAQGLNISEVVEEFLREVIDSK